MSEIFLSASVPVRGRGSYYESADPFLIQVAVREFVSAVINDHVIVWGGHPAITPMLWAVCEDLGVGYAASVILYQSRFFEEQFPEENARFGNVIFVDAVSGDRDASLTRMREAMLSRPRLESAVFIGGMDGVEIEHSMFLRFHPTGLTVPVASPGGAARNLAAHFDRFRVAADDDIDFARLFRNSFPKRQGR